MTQPLIKSGARIRTKTVTTPGLVATIPPSDNHKDGTWIKTDIYVGELLYNSSDGIIYTRDTFDNIQIVTSNMNNYYTKGQSDANFVSGTTLTLYYTKTQSDANYLSANTSYYTQAQTNANFLSATTLSNYYTKTQSNANFLSANTSYYTQAQANANFLSASTSINLSGYYTTAQTNANFLSANTSYYTQAQTNANFLSATTLSNYYTKTQVYNTGQTYTQSQINALLTGVTTDLSGYYTSAQTNANFLSASTNLTYTNSNPSVITVGGISIGSTFSASTMTDLFDMMLYPELFPTLTNPSSSFSFTQSGLHEIGELIATLNFSSVFSRGSISPAYGTSGYRSGLPNTYVYTGYGLSNVLSTSLSDSETATGYTVVNGSQSWSGAVKYDIGEQPKSSKGNNYSTPLPSGQTSTSTQTITGVYPTFATTVAIDTMTKQPLALMNSTYIGVTMVAEDDTNKQKMEFPTVWSVITGIQFYNTVSSTWEWIGGSKANSLLTFDITSVTETIQGNIINYNRYTNNGAKIGSRQLRFYTT